jgi:hypothetical protein
VQDRCPPRARARCATNDDGGSLAKTNARYVFVRTPSRRLFEPRNTLLEHQPPPLSTPPASSTSPRPANDLAVVRIRWILNPRNDRNRIGREKKRQDPRTLLICPRVYPRLVVACLPPAPCRHIATIRGHKNSRRWRAEKKAVARARARARERGETKGVVGSAE